jgi:hypothetical protein
LSVSPQVVCFDLAVVRDGSPVGAHWTRRHVGRCDGEAFPLPLQDGCLASRGPKRSRAFAVQRASPAPGSSLAECSGPYLRHLELLLVILKCASLAIGQVLGAGFSGSLQVGRSPRVRSGADTAVARFLVLRFALRSQFRLPSQRPVPPSPPSPPTPTPTPHPQADSQASGGLNAGLRADR